MRAICDHFVGPTDDPYDPCAVCGHMSGEHDPPLVDRYGNLRREYGPQSDEEMAASRRRLRADDRELLAPLEAAVLDALSEVDLRYAAVFVRRADLYDEWTELADRLEAAADAFHALEAQQ